MALWTTPLILLCPLWLGYLVKPSLIVEAPEIFALFLVLPLGAAALLYRLAARLPSE